jgi:hypothetical protein
MPMPSSVPEPVIPAPTTFLKTLLYELNLRSALWAGVVGAVAMTVYMFVVPRALGIPQMDIGITIGRLCDPNDSYGLSYWVGWTLWHVVNAVIYVFPYALVIWLLRQASVRLFGVWWQSDVFTGFLFGLVLLNIGPMWTIPMMLAETPEVQARGLTNPGIYMLDLGLGWLPALVDFGAHSLHGCLVGILYKQRGA